QAADLARREESDRLPGEPQTVADDERGVPMIEDAAVEGGDELRQVPDAPTPGKPELAAMRVARKNERRTERRGLRKAIGAVGQHDERRVGWEVAREPWERGVLRDAACPVAAAVVEAEH